MGDIAERAEVNRATVYLHYKDRDDLLLDASESTMAEIVDAARACRLSPSARTPSQTTPAHLIRLFANVDQHRSLYGLMLSEEGSSRFTARLQRLLAEAWFEQLLAESDEEDETTLLVRAHYVSGAVLAVLSRWARGDFEAAEDEGTSTAHGAAPMDSERIAQITWSLIRGKP